MKYQIAGLIVLSHLLVSTTHAQVEAGLQAIIELSQVNGQALACQEQLTAARAKGLMLRHAPKTARFGSAFDEGTNQAFLAQTRTDTPCPDQASLTLRLTALALQLQASLPVSQAPISNTTSP